MTTGASKSEADTENPMVKQVTLNTKMEKERVKKQIAKRYRALGL